MKIIWILVFFFIGISSYSQQRLELLQTNVPAEKIEAYADSYLWTKNWWLTNGMLADVEKGGNALSDKSKLNKTRIDSLGKLFRTSLPPQLIRFGKMKPRLSYEKSTKPPYYILSTIYEINSEDVKPLGQFKIVFGSAMHNQMADVMDIQLIPAGEIKTIDKKLVISTYNRKATPVEINIQGPDVSN